jgi:hypothetical protein
MQRKEMATKKRAVRRLESSTSIMGTQMMR